MFINLHPLFFTIPLILSTLRYLVTKFMNKSGFKFATNLFVSHLATLKVLFASKISLLFG